MKRLCLSLVILIMATFLGGCAPTVSNPAPAAMPTAAPMAPATSTAPVLPAAQTDLDRLVAAAQKEGKLTVYAVLWISDVGTAVSRAFKEKYGIPMEIITGKGTDFLERIKTEQRIGQPVADLMEGSSASMTKLKKEGLNMPLVDLPIFQEPGVWVSHPLGTEGKGPSAGYTFSAINMWVNTKLVPPPEEPRSLKDLLQPKWKGKLVIPEPTINSGAYMQFVPLVNNKALDWETVKGFGRQDMKYARTTADMFRLMLARGEASATPMGADLLGAPAAMEGAPIKAIPPDEGTVIALEGVALVKNSPHPNAARLLANWLLTLEGQTTILKAMGTPTVRKDGPDFRPAATRYQMKKIIIESPSDSEEETVKMRDRFLPNLWK